MNCRTSLLLPSLAIAAFLLLPGCKSLKEKVASVTEAAAPLPVAGTDPGVSALLGMSFAEASSIAPQHLDEPHLPKVAADNLEVLSKTADGKPKKVRAKGRVFLQLDQLGEAHALCNEALIGNDGELILRGRPVLQRGSSTVEGLSDVTVFYMYGQQLKVIGRHRVTNSSQLTGTSPWASTVTSGPASLLPPLDSADVPQAVRDEMRKAAEAEAQLQRSRAGLPAAFPEALDGTPHPASIVPTPATKPKDG